MTTGVGPASRSPTTRYHVSCPFQLISAMSGLLVIERVMACREAAVAVVDEQWTFDVTDLRRVPAARMEAAAARRIDRARHLALEHDALAARSVVVGLD